MTVTLNLPQQVEQAYLAEAQARGLSLDEIVREVLMAAKPGSGVAELSPEEWIREYRTWSQSAAHADLPVLSDEAMSRESIYAERGL